MITAREFWETYQPTVSRFASYNDDDFRSTPKMSTIEQNQSPGLGSSILNQKRRNQSATKKIWEWCCFCFI